MVVRYILKKRFDRGSYGEVWLAFHWNSSLGTNASRWRFPSSTFDPGSCDEDVHSSFSSDCSAGLPDDIKFILKRIMVVIQYPYSSSFLWCVINVRILIQCYRQFIKQCNSQPNIFSHSPGVGFFPCCICLFIMTTAKISALKLAEVCSCLLRLNKSGFACLLCYFPLSFKTLVREIATYAS